MVHYKLRFTLADGYECNILNLYNPNPNLLSSIWWISNFSLWVWKCWMNCAWKNFLKGFSSMIWAPFQMLSQENKVFYLLSLLIFISVSVIGLMNLNCIKECAASSSCGCHCFGGECLLWCCTQQLKTKLHYFLKGKELVRVHAVHCQ